MDSAPWSGTEPLPQLASLAEYEAAGPPGLSDHEEELVLRLSGAMAERARAAQLELPAFPAMAGKVLNIMEQPEPELRALVEVVRHDAMISAQVLRMANSAFYSRGVEVATVHAAVVRLGIKAVASVAIAAATRALLDAQERDYHDCFRERWHQLGRYSLQCAASSRWLSLWLHRAAPEEAFLGGLMHDLGKMVGLRLAGQMVFEGDLPADVAPAVLERVLEETHVGLGEQLVAAWNLPEQLAEVIDLHHQPEPAASRPFEILHVVRVASGLYEWRTNRLHRPELLREVAFSAHALQIEPEPLAAIARELKRLGEGSPW